MKKILIFILFILLELARAEPIYNEDSQSQDYEDNTDSTEDYVEESTTIQHNDYYDEEDDSALTEDEKQPYECPSQCKCEFEKQNQIEIENDDLTASDNTFGDYYENNEIKSRKKRNSDYETETNDDYDLNEVKQSSNLSDSKKNKKKLKYNIHVDCSNQNLNTINYLFSDDFPLDQIVSFNLSNNKFRLLKLDDGFEDLINLRELDLSSNANLKSLSPRNFLKKFRHLEKIYLNNLNQINCDTTIGSNSQKLSINKLLIPIDCKWLRTLLYLYKRNISVVMQHPFKCDLNRLVNSVSLMSRCFTDLYNSYRFSPENSASNQTELQADNSKYEFRIEPELNQILIEGDTLELSCKLKKLNILKKSRSKNQNFYRSQIKWYLNDNQQLMISTVFYNKESPTQIQIIENKSKFKQDDLIESKLIISNTISTQHTGKYTCVASLYLTDRRLSINTTKIEIKVLSRQQLSILESSPQALDTSKSKLYCPEIITQTYRGVYKWPKTLAGSKITQKCAFTSNNSSNLFAKFECLSTGKWSDQMDLADCLYESNLTRYLGQIKNELNLEDLLKKILNIKSNESNEFTLSMFDVYLVQKLISSNNNLTSLKHEFMFLNDLLSRLNIFYLKQAFLIDQKLYSKYFFNSLLDLVKQDTTLLSNYLTSLRLNSTSNCLLYKYDLTKHIYFKCAQNKQDQNEPYSQIELLNNSNLSLILFENDKLVPIETNLTNLTNYQLLNLIDYDQVLDLNYKLDQSEHTSSQIVLFLPTDNQTDVNLTLEINTPKIFDKFFKLINEFLMSQKLVENKTNSNRIEKNKNLFDQVFKLNQDEDEDEEAKNKYFYFNNLNDKSSNLLIKNKDLLLVNEKINLNINSKRLKKFKNIYFNQWLNSKRYLIRFGCLNETNRLVKWSNDVNNECKLNWLRPSMRQNELKLFVNLNCSLSKTNKIRFLGVQNLDYGANMSSNDSDKSLKMVFEMIDKYAQMNRFNINESSSTQTSLFLDSIKSNYFFFKYNILYFSAVLSCLILFINIIVYMIYSKNLMMPRSFYHTLVNTWLSILLLIFSYTIGINQIYVPHLCLFSGFFLHYLLLTSFIWYLLYYWSLYSKLNVLKTRNFDLIFNKNNDFNLKKNLNNYNGLDDDQDEDYLQKPVAHLYMLGWGSPLLLVSIILSITKRDYIQTPFNYCFTNEPNILIGSVLIPLGFLSLIQFIFVVLILLTVKRILNDLKKDEDKSEENLIENKIEDKKELCKNWINSKVDEKLNDLKENDLIEVKMNPNRTQKSLIINASRFNNQPSDSDYDGSNTSLANSDSDRTSIMDAQHKPQIQLKFSLFSWFLFVLIVVFSSLLIKSSFYDLFLDQTKLISYLLSFLMFIYSILQISFYVLSRDDIIMFEMDFKFKFFKSSRNDLVNEVNQVSEETTNDNNWYFEPKGVECEPPKENSENSTNLELSSDDNEHKKSMSDVIFSSTTKKTLPEQNQLEYEQQQQSSSTTSIKSSSSEVISSEATSTNFNQIKSFKIDEDSKSEMTNTNGICPTLATQEDLSDYVSSPSNKTRGHVRKASQTILYESRISKKQSGLIKKQPYILTEYNLEQKSQVNLKREEEVIYQEFISNMSVNSSKKKLDDLLSNNTCLSQTGTALETIPSMVRDTKSSLSNATTNTQTISSNSCNSLVKTNKRRSNGSVSSSVVSSSNDSNLNQNQINVNYIENVYPEDDSNMYQIYSSLNNSNRIYNNTKIHTHEYRRQKTISTLPIRNNSGPRPNSKRNGSLLRNNNLIRTKEQDIGTHETSV